VRLGWVRLRLALTFALITAVAVGVMAFFAIRFGTARLEDQAERDLRDQVARVVPRIDPRNISALPADEPDTWLVSTARNQQPKKLGASKIEPPLISIATDAVQGGPQQQRYSQNGSDYLLYAQPLGRSAPRLVIVGARPLAAEQSDADSLRLRIGLAAALVVVFTLVAGFWLAGRWLRPARRALEQQQEFLANAAHELRTPIAVIQASASQALSRQRPTEEYVLALAEIRHAAERAGRSVSDLLDLARFDAHQAVLRRAPLRLDLLAEEVAASVPTEDVVVEVVPSDPVVVPADYSLLRQAIDNVVRNATRRASHVELEVSGFRKDVCVEVRDDGPGFPADLLPSVFERWRSGNGRTDRRGSGLGLSIVRSIVEAHGGHAEAANRPEGGAMIRLWLPRTRH